MSKIERKIKELSELIKEFKAAENTKDAASMAVDIAYFASKNFEPIITDLKRQIIQLEGLVTTVGMNNNKIDSELFELKRQNDVMYEMLLENNIIALNQKI